MRRYMELGLGVLRWPPAVFWSATVPELVAALDGYVESKGGGSRSAKQQFVDEMRALSETDTGPSKSIADDPRAVVIGG